MGRGELTDKAWARIEPLLPPIESGGRRWRDHRQVINAILWKLRTGAPWARSARALWALEGRARTAAYLDQGRHLGTHPRPGHRQRRRGRQRGVDVQHRFEFRPGPPACGWGRGHLGGPAGGEHGLIRLSANDPPPPEQTRPRPDTLRRVRHETGRSGDAAANTKLAPATTDAEVIDRLSLAWIHRRVGFWSGV